MVPEPAADKAKKSASVAVQPNGLPEGVQILPLKGPQPAPATKAASAPKAGTEALAEPPGSPAQAQAPAASASAGTATDAIAGATADTAAKVSPARSSASAKAVALVHPRSRLISPEAPAAKPRKRKPGRPKSGRLDTPASQSATLANPPRPPHTSQTSQPAPAEPTPESTPSDPNPSPNPSPPTTPTPVPTTPPPVRSAAGKGSRRLSDLAPRRPAAGHQPPDSLPVHQRPASRRQSPPGPHHQLHKVGVPPLHFGAVIGLSLRSRLRPRHLGLAALAAGSFAAALAYTAWLLLAGGLDRLAGSLLHSDWRLYAELLILAALYYIGRSLGQGAITYGLAREADARPVPASSQIAAAVNTFGRRLVLDLAVGLAECTLLIAIAALVLLGGGDWHLAPQLQMGILFVIFLALLYLAASLSLTRGLAGVVITLTTQRPLAAAKLGWQLFRHRFEILGLKAGADALELILALPLAMLAAAVIAITPNSLHLISALAVGLVAWLAGALLGAGTAAWWTALYRRIVAVDHPNRTAELLSGRQPAPVRPGLLAAIVAVGSFLLAAALAVPWLKLS